MAGKNSYEAVPDIRVVYTKVSAMAAKSEPRVDTTSNPHSTMNLLTQEINEFRSAWREGVRQPPFQMRSRTSSNLGAEFDADHFGAEYRALIADADEASTDDRAEAYKDPNGSSVAGIQSTESRRRAMEALEDFLGDIKRRAIDLDDYDVALGGGQGKILPVPIESGYPSSRGHEGDAAQDGPSNPTTESTAGTLPRGEVARMSAFHDRSKV